VSEVYAYGKVLLMNGLLVDGLAIVEDHLLFTTTHQQIRFPRSKRLRIRAKWAKNKANWKTTHTPQAYQMGSTIFAHPAIAQRIREMSR